MKKTIVLHCSDSTFGNAAIIDKWHRDRGFRCVGYHFVILNGCVVKSKYKSIYDGMVESGRDYDDSGAHVRGHNTDTIGICLIGNSGDFTSAQYLSLGGLICGLSKDFEIEDIKQHSDYDTKKPICAGLDSSVIDMLTKII